MNEGMCGIHDSRNIRINDLNMNSTARVIDSIMNGSVNSGIQGSLMNT